MIILSALGAAIVAIGVGQTIRLVATDGYGRVPTRQA